MTVPTKEQHTAKGAPGVGFWGRLVRALTSVRLTLWLLAFLTLAMAVATLIPQHASEEAYLKYFGVLFGRFIARSMLSHTFESWQFIAAWALLAANMLACALQRSARLLRGERELPAHLTRAEVESRSRRERWQVPSNAPTAAQTIAEHLRRRGYTVAQVPGKETGQVGLLARRGRAHAWAPVLVHFGMVIVLLGAAWGRLPRNAYHSTVAVGTGETVPVKVGDEAFGLRLLDAGTKYDAQHRPSDYWAKAEVLEEGTVMRSALIRPNAPLRYHGVSLTLNSLGEAGLGVEVTRGKEQVVVPVSLGPDGAVDLQQSYAVVHGEPHWLVVAAALRGTDDHGRPGMSVLVKLGQMSETGHDLQDLGWVGPAGLEAKGAHFRLVQQPGGATFGLDRDIGVPIVFFGFLLAALGTLLLLSSPRRSVAALVSPRGKGAHVLLGVSASGVGKEAARLLSQLDTELGGTREPEPQPSSKEKG